MIKSLQSQFWFRIVCAVDAGWSSLVARRAHNPKVIGSNPVPATKFSLDRSMPLSGNKACNRHLGFVLCAPVDAGWSSLVARRAHNPKVIGSNPVPATKFMPRFFEAFYYELFLRWALWLIFCFESHVYKATTKIV